MVGGYRRSAFRLCGTWCWIPHMLWGAAAAWLCVHGSELLGAVMVLVYLVYQFEETVVDAFTGKRDAVEWDWPEEELRELMAGMALGLLAALAHAQGWLTLP